jgi:hypothetical protein
MSWSQRTVEERINIMIRHYQTMLKRIDPDGTALTHDTYVNDKERYDLASEWDNFVRQLECLKEPVTWVPPKMHPVMELRTQRRFRR